MELEMLATMMAPEKEVDEQVDIDTFFDFLNEGEEKDD